MEGIVAAGHPVSAEAGAAVLRAGGNAVDAAIAASTALPPARSTSSAASVDKGWEVAAIPSRP